MRLPGKRILLAFVVGLGVMVVFGAGVYGLIVGSMVSVMTYLIVKRVP